MATVERSFSRANPSPRYRELLAQYRTMHIRGEQFQNIPPEQTFSGQSLPRHAGNIKQLIDLHAARTLLDYGAGKGAQYQPLRVDVPGLGQFASIPEYWGVDNITCYDPGFEPFSRLPSGQFDGVISTDVLEHCPEDDIAWILGEMFRFAAKFLYANVACYPAKKRLSNGENAHCTIRPADWWQTQLSDVADVYPTVRYYVCLDQLFALPDGRQEMTQTWLQG